MTDNDSEFHGKEKEKSAKRIGNMVEIKTKLKKAKLPKTFRLNSGEQVTDVPKFIESHLILLSEDLLPTHRPCFKRFSKLMKKLKIDIEIVDAE